MNIPQYEYFFNDESIELIKWVAGEKNRLKKTKIYRTACRMEKLFRNKHCLPDECHWWGTQRARSMSFIAARYCTLPPSGGGSNVITSRVVRHE